MTFKYNKIKSEVIFSSLFLLSLTLSSCGPKYFYHKTECKGGELKITNKSKTWGDVIVPENIKLTNTLPELFKNKTYPYYVMPQNIDSIDVLVLPIQFEDSNNFLFEDEIKANINSVLNGSDTKKIYPTSVKDFYYKSSYQKINLNFKVADWYKTSSSKLIKTEEDVDKLVLKASEEPKINGQKINLKDFDKNKDGALDAVIAIYDVPNYTNTPGSNNKVFWAYTVSKSIEDKTKNNPKPLLYSFMSYDFMDGYFNALSARTYIHEVGHLLGLSDLYDYGNLYYPTAGFDMMDLNLFDHNSYSKMCLGWTKPYLVYGNAIINKDELIKSNSPIVILEDKKELYYFDDNKYLFNPFKEYILVDYFDASESSLNYFDLNNEPKQSNTPKIDIDKSGFRIFHVDGRLLNLKMLNKEVYGEFYSDFFSINEDELGVKVITNSSKEAPLSETKVIEKLGFNYLLEENKNIDYFNELTLLPKNADKLNQDYKNLFYLEDENSNGEKVRTPLTNDMLFFEGDVFKPNEVYGKYFVNGKTDKNLNFNDGKGTFSTSIYFE